MQSGDSHLQAPARSSRARNAFTPGTLSQGHVQQPWETQPNEVWEDVVLLPLASFKWRWGDGFERQNGE